MQQKNDQTDRVQVRAEELADEYETLQRAQDAIDERREVLKQEIIKFAQEQNLRTIQTNSVILKVYRKVKTIFPKAKQRGREQIEEIMRKSDGEWKHAISFSITKLSRAYDKNQLSDELKKQLEPFAKQEEVARIVMKKKLGSKNQM